MGWFMVIIFGWFAYEEISKRLTKIEKALEDKEEY